MHPLRKQIEDSVQLNDQEFEFILSHFQERHFKKHQIVLHEGDFARQEYFVLHGLMNLSQTDTTGKEHILKFATENRWITDSESYEHGKKATLRIVCLENTHALSISKDSKVHLCQDLPKMEKYFLKKTTLELLEIQKRMCCFLSGNTSDRFHSLLSGYPGLLQRIPKSMVASYLGVSRETLSRISDPEN